MSTTLVRKSQIRPLNIIRSDINTTTSGSALITKVIAGTGLTLSSTGVNSGTGDVTITLTPATASVLGGVKIGSGLTVGIDGTISVNTINPSWGTITGTLSNQIDLQNALDAKYNNPTGTTADYIDGTGAIQAFPLTLPTEFISHEVKSSNHINKGQAVYVSDANGTNMIVDLASNSAELTSSKTMGLIDRTVNPNDLARVVTEGLLDGLDTSAAQPGDPVWLGVNGDLIFGLGNKPVAPHHLVFIGIVTRVQQNNGEIFVKVQNGYEFNELHNYLEDGLQNNYVIAYESSTSLYKPKSIATLLGYTPADNGGVVHTTGNETIAGIKTFSSTTQSTSTGTGAVVIGGGLGVAKNLYVGGDFFLSGNLTIGGTTTTVNAQNLSVSDNMIYLNNGIQTTITNAVGNGSTVVYTTQEVHNYAIGMVVTISGVTPSAYNLSNQTITAVTANSFTVANSATGTYSSGGTARAKSAVNPDLGFAGGYNDGSYAHAGLFRDATDNVWKFFKGYTPEPDASPYIDTAHASFAYADLRVATMTATSFVKVGGTSAQFLKADGSVDTNTYLTSFTETDPTVPAHVKSITTTEKSNWNTAYSWGNHAVQGYATTTYVDTQVGTRLPLAGGTMTGNINWAQTDRGLTWGMNTDGAYIKFFNTGDGDTDSRLEYATSDNGDEYHRWVISGVERMNLKTAGLSVNGIIYSTGYGDSTQWNSAYSWGNHAGLYASASHTHTFASLTSKPTTLSGYGITDAQPLDGDLTSIAGLTGTTGLLKKTAANTWTLDTSTYLTSNQSISISGDATGSGATSITLVLANSGVAIGTYNNVTVNAKGLVTSGSNVSYLTSYTETDTLATVTARGSTTYGSVSLLGGASISVLSLNGATTSTEASLFLGSHGPSEGGQMVFAKGAGQTYATHLDNYADQFRIMYGTNTGSAGVALAVSMSSKQLILPAYTSSTSFTGTVAGYLAFDASGNVISVAAPTGAVTSVNAGTGVSVNQTTGAVTVSIGQSVATSASPTFDQIITTNNGNGTNVKLGDDVWIGDVNRANTFGVKGLQDSTAGYITFGSDLATSLGRIGTGDLTWGGNKVWTAANLTDLNQLTNTPGYLTSITSSQITTALGYTPVTNARTITINGTGYDLSANRSWTVGDVLTSGTYANPSWITSLAWGKVTGTPTTISGYGITDAITTSNIGSQSVSYSNYTGYISSFDTRAGASTPQSYDARIRFDFKQNTTNGLSDGGTYNGVMYWRKYGSTTDWSGGGAIEIAYTDNGNLWHRYGTGTSWGSWRRVWNGNDFSSTNISNWNTAFGWGNHASAGYLTGITSAQVTTALGYTPYNSTNPSGYITSSALTGYATQTWVNSQGFVTGGPYLPLTGGTLSGNLYTNSEISFRDGAGTFSNTIRSAAYPSEGYPSGSNYWLEYRAKGGHHFVLNVDGGVGAPPNNMDDFIVWQGDIDGDRLLELSNAGNLTIRGMLTEQSSLRYKENIVSLESVTDKVGKLRPVRYNKIGSSVNEIGLIAEEVAELFPEFVNYNAKGDVESLNYTRLSVVLLQTVKELSDKINKLETK